jgi:hypothetical protein
MSAVVCPPAASFTKRYTARSVANRDDQAINVTQILGLFTRLPTAVVIAVDPLREIELRGYNREH